MILQYLITGVVRVSLMALFFLIIQFLTLLGVLNSITQNGITIPITGSFLLKSYATANPTIGINSNEMSGNNLVLDITTMYIHALNNVPIHSIIINDTSPTVKGGHS